MENGAFAPWSKCSIFHNIFIYIVFQRRQNVLLWSKGLMMVSSPTVPSLTLSRKLSCCLNFFVTELNTGIKDTMQSLYSTPPNNTDLDITLSCCGSQKFLPWYFTKKLKEMSFSYSSFIKNCPFIIWFTYNMVHSNGPQIYPLPL